MTRPKHPRLANVTRLCIVIARGGAAWLAAAFLLAWIVGVLATDRWLWSQWLWWIPGLAALGAAALGFLVAWLGGTDKRQRRLPILQALGLPLLRGTHIWGLIIAALLLHVLFIENRFFRAPPPPVSESLRIAHINVADNDRDERNAAMERTLDLNADLTILTDAQLVPWQQRVREKFINDVHTASRFPFGVISRLPIIEARSLVAVDDIYATLLRIDGQSSPVGGELVILLIDLPSDLSLARMALTRRLRDLLDELDYPKPDLVIGDFNITRGSASLTEIVPDLRHAWNAAGRGWGASYPRVWPIAHIDHVFFNPDTVRVLDYELSNLGAARHRAQHVAVIGVPE